MKTYSTYLRITWDRVVTGPYFFSLASDEKDKVDQYGHYEQVNQDTHFRLFLA